MRSLYESILDDDDVLFDKAKQHDPFEVFVSAIDSGMSKDEISELLNDKLFNDFIENELYLDSKEFFWRLLTYNDSIVSAGLKNKDNPILPFIIRYRRKTKQFDIEIYKFSRSGRFSDIFEYDKYKKTLSNFRKRGFKKSTWSLDKMGNYNVYNRSTK